MPELDPNIIEANRERINELTSEGMTLDEAMQQVMREKSAPPSSPIPPPSPSAPPIPVSKPVSSFSPRPSTDRRSSYMSRVPEALTTENDVGVLNSRRKAAQIKADNEIIVAKINNVKLSKRYAEVLGQDVTINEAGAVNRDLSANVRPVNRYMQLFDPDMKVGVRRAPSTTASGPVILATADTERKGKESFIEDTYSGVKRKRKGKKAKKGFYISEEQLRTFNRKKK